MAQMFFDALGVFFELAFIGGACCLWCAGLLKSIFYQIQCLLPRKGVLRVEVLRGFVHRAFVCCRAPLQVLLVCGSEGGALCRSW